MEKISFAEKEHNAGQHKTFTDHCYACHKENRLLRAKQVVDKPDIDAMMDDNSDDRPPQWIEKDEDRPLFL